MVSSGRSGNTGEPTEDEPAVGDLAVGGRDQLGGQVQETSPGKGVVARMQWREPARQVKDVGVAGQAVKQDPLGSDGVLGWGPTPGRHNQKVSQNRLRWMSPCRLQHADRSGGRLPRAGLGDVR
jgi:hypothetical protein